MADTAGSSTRLAKREDLDELCKCWWLLVNEQNALDPRAAKTEENERRAKNFLRDRILRGWMFVTTSQTGSIIGIGTIARDQFFLSGGPDVWNVADIWVDPDHRRSGIASRMMSYIEAQAARRGATHLRLSVYTANEAASGLYSELEYRPLMHTLEKQLTEFSSNGGEGQGS